MHLMFSKTFSKLNLDVSSHDFRHTRITELVNAGMPVADVQAYVGHNWADTTLSYVKKKQTNEILQGIVHFNL
jgi:site-specific recombinase XerD